MNRTTPVKASAEHNSSADHHHVMPLRQYFIIFAALLFLTVITVIVSYLNLGGTLAIGAALIVALIKAVLVAAYFMHLKGENHFNILLAVSSVFFIVLFFSFTFIDLDTRGRIVKSQDNWTLIHDQAAEQAEPSK